ncbi:MAG TPA: flagellar FlbD family protein [Acidobacteriaceae bacterium]|jgi:flagellar protein FlbD|nr:flagellar FlbD family protein [Acidobacteriaceae bacterium]
MILLTRLNGEAMVLNSDLIRYAEANPDTVITLVTGEKIVVSESCEELMARVMEYRAELLRVAFPNQQVVVAESASARGSATGAKAAGNAVEAAHTAANANADSDDSWRRRRRDSD